MEQKTPLTAELNEEELAHVTDGFLNALTHRFHESSSSRSDRSASWHTAEPPPPTKNTDVVSHQIPGELSEQDMPTVNGGAKIIDISHLGRTSSTLSDAFHDASSASFRDSSSVLEGTVAPSKKSLLKHPVTQALAAGVTATLAVKGAAYAVHDIFNH